MGPPAAQPFRVELRDRGVGRAGLGAPRRTPRPRSPHGVAAALFRGRTDVGESNARLAAVCISGRPRATSQSRPPVHDPPGPPPAPNRGPPPRPPPPPPPPAPPRP